MYILIVFTKIYLCILNWYSYTTAFYLLPMFTLSRLSKIDWKRLFFNNKVACCVLSTAICKFLCVLYNGKLQQTTYILLD